MAQARPEAEMQVIQACIDKENQEGEAPEQIHFQGQSGGDKYRLTLIASIARSGWFEPGQKPKGHLLPFVLLVPCAQHTRLEDLDDQGRFNKEVQYRGPDDSPVVFHEKQSAKGKLKTWVQFRKDYPDHPFWSMATVWGQPRAWQDQVISAWLQERLASMCPPQMIHMQDCLDASWSEPSLDVAYRRLPGESIRLPI